MVAFTAAFVAAVMAFANVEAIKLSQIEVHQDTKCTSALDTAIPFQVANTCTAFTDSSIKFNCDALTFDIFLGSTTCVDIGGGGIVTGKVSADFACSNSTGTGPAVGFGCADFPDSKVVILSIGDPCNSESDTSAPNQAISIAVVVNTCFKFPSMNGEVQTDASFFRMTVSASGTVTARAFDDPLCTGAGTVAYEGILDGCRNVQISAGAGFSIGRRLQTQNGVAVKTAAPGAQIERTNSAVLNGVSMIIAMVALAATAGLMA